MQDTFWAQVRLAVGGKDIGEKERLSAIGLIKRMFPKVAQQAIGWDPRADRFPSTSLLSAAEWLSRRLAPGSGNESWAKSFVSLADRLQGSTNEDPSGIRSLLMAMTSSAVPELAHLDANLFYVSSLDSPDWPSDTEHIRRSMKKALGDLRDSQGLKDSPGAFYAVLSLDGDHLGDLISIHGGQVISCALARYSNDLSAIVKEHDGILIYAGGDDVLGLLPTEGAISAAVKLQRAYSRAFEGTGVKATISGAVVYAHRTAPLQQIIGHSHYILEAIAKEQLGRNSFVASVWKTGGPTILWGAPWQVVEGRGEGMTAIETLARRLREDDLLSNRFFYKLWQLLKGTAEGLQEVAVEPLLVSEVARSVAASKRTDDILERAQELVNLMLPLLRDYSGRPAKFDVSAGLLARFLAARGGTDHE